MDFGFALSIRKSKHICWWEWDCGRIHTQCLWFPTLFTIQRALLLIFWLQGTGYCFGHIAQIDCRLLRKSCFFQSRSNWTWDHLQPFWLSRLASLARALLFCLLGRFSRRTSKAESGNLTLCHIRRGCYYLLNCQSTCNEQSVLKTTSNTYDFFIVDPRDYCESVLKVHYVASLL